ncbi:lysine-rich arabinogalactan protein 19-like [Cannabis sativa]|uniref:lysine-rich arabinogalactan protein 19-like n=1 Tax=Cannabis sativa TaxID=3483 RepID=UPI0029C9EF89|nr:lysine-rich arabinogalactan protein 19-like [Cannabis sativa]
MDTPSEAAKVDHDVAEPNSDATNDESAATTETGEPEPSKIVRTKNLGHPKKLMVTDATPSNVPPTASTIPPAAAKTGDSSLPQRESQPLKPKRLPKQVARKSVCPVWTSSSSSSSKASPPPAAVPPLTASVPASTPSGPSTRTRA